jgi:hypothetical protein
MKTLFRTMVSALAMAAIVSAGAPAFTIAAETGAETGAATGIAADATAVPAAVERRAPQTVRVELETMGKVAELNDGSTYRYWTFDGQVPGPMLRGRAGGSRRMPRSRRSAAPRPALRNREGVTTMRSRLVEHPAARRWSIPPRGDARPDRAHPRGLSRDAPPRLPELGPETQPVGVPNDDGAVSSIFTTAGALAY